MAAATVPSVNDWINTHFDQWESTRAARFGIFKRALEKVRSLALANAPAIAAQLPADFAGTLTPVQIMDVVFTVLEAIFPAEAAILEMLKGWLDALFTTPPAAV